MGGRGGTSWWRGPAGWEMLAEGRRRSVGNVGLQWDCLTEGFALFCLVGLIMVKILWMREAVCASGILSQSQPVRRFRVSRRISTRVPKPAYTLQTNFVKRSKNLQGQPALSPRCAIHPRLAHKPIGCRPCILIVFQPPFPLTAPLGSRRDAVTKPPVSLPRRETGPSGPHRRLAAHKRRGCWIQVRLQRGRR